MMLDDTTVLDLSIVLPGSYATMLLADLGADVIKVERPPEGEFSRTEDPHVNGMGYRFAQRNRNKRSIVLDLKSDAGLKAFVELVEEADVVLEGFRPGVMERLGIDYETLRDVNPELVFCSLSGYGRESPYRDWPGHDLNYIGITGLLDATRKEDAQGERDALPTIPGYPIADMSSGLFAAFSILAALTQRDQYGGQHVEVPMADVIFSWNVVHSGEHFGFDDYDPLRTVNTGRYACYNVYEAADGKEFTLGAFEPKFWYRFCEAAGLPELADEHMSEENRTERLETVRERLRTEPREYWIGTLSERDVPVAPVNSLAESFEDPHVRERNLVETVEYDGAEIEQLRSPARFSQYSHPMERPPILGEHSEPILRSLGYSDEEIRSMINDGAVIAASSDVV